VAGLFLLAGAAALGVALASQRHAPSPTPAAAGVVAGPVSFPSAKPQKPAAASAEPSQAEPSLAESTPESIVIPAIGVHSVIQQVGLAANGTIQVPPLGYTPLTNEAAWFKYSPSPGQIGASIIEGHIDSAYQGPSVFFRLGALLPGDRIEVTLADGVTGIFAVTGVREYPKAVFPTALLYGDPGYAALNLVTCGGSFDSATRHYLSNIIVFARLVGSRAPAGPVAVTSHGQPRPSARISARRPQPDRT
jgi:hypothetical protein